MRPSENIKILATKMTQQQDKNSGPYLLFLGVGCARAAGVPSPAQVARPILEDLFRRDAKLAATLLPDKDAADEAQLLQACLSLLGGMSAVQRYRVLQPIYSRIPVPIFYQDLAVLIRAGYFSHILTTNIDSLLEQALNGAGMQRGSNYQVVVLSAPPDTQLSMNPRPTPDNSITIVKLHGDLGQSEIPVSPDEIEGVLYSYRRLMQGELRGDVVMVGYEFESEPVNQWLSRTTTATVGELWWVSPESPDPDKLAPVQQARPVFYVEPKSATPDAFFGQLVLMLLRMPVLKSLTTSFDEYVNTPDVAFSSPAETISGISPDDDELAVEYLRGQLRRSQELLYSLQQSVVRGEKNVQLRAQIEYQQKQIAELEDQLRGLTNDRPRVVELMEQIGAAVQRADTDPSTTSFVQNQLNVVKEEYARDQPNRHVIYAAIGATVALSERLGAEVVKPELVRELAFGTGSARRGPAC